MMDYKVCEFTGHVVTNDEKEEIVLVTRRHEAEMYASALNNGVDPEDEEAIEEYVRKEKSLVAA